MELAMKNYSAYTLIGTSWQEQRTTLPPLRGITADYGFLERTTTAAGDFLPPQERLVQPPKPRFGMVTAETLNEAAFAYGAGIPATSKLDATSTLAAATRLGTAEARISHTTTMRAGNQDSTQIGVPAAKAAAASAVDLHYSMHAPAAGLQGPRVERGRRTVGITGEIVRMDGDPKNQTAAQRSWLGRTDPSIAAYMAPPAAPPERSYMSLTMPSEMAEAAMIGSGLGATGGRGRGAGGGSSINMAAALAATGAGPGAYAEAIGTVKLADVGAPHGRLAAFSAAPRVITSITATQKELAMRKGRTVFADDAF